MIYFYAHPLMTMHVCHVVNMITRQLANGWFIGIN